MDKVKHGLVQLFIAFDQLLNVLLWPFSFNTWADETFSSRCGRLGHRRPYRYFEMLVDFLFLWQGPGHCKRAYANEKKRYNCPPEMRYSDVSTNHIRITMNRIDPSDLDTETGNGDPPKPTKSPEPPPENP